MIPREILKKIRQIELRTNRLVTGSAERGCVQSTSRSTPDISNASANHHALRLGLRPQSRSVSVCRNSKPLEFDGVKIQAVTHIDSNSIEFDGIRNLANPFDMR